MFEAFSRARLPLLLLSLLLLVGGSKLDAVRPLEGQIVAFVIPAVAVISGVAPFSDAHGPLRNRVFALGTVVLALSELASYQAVFEAAPLFALATPLAFAVALPFAVWAEVGGARRGLRSRLTAWLGLAMVFALYFRGHALKNNLFGSVFAAFFVALFLGGGAGLCVGEFAVRRARSA
ncbi:MAG TPA: hypothetical protein VFK05_01945 [Polyangiaceae bacterium]|nr:hypothetical protein [Polyangiaceae bacterium]